MYSMTKPTRTYLSVASGLLCLVMVMGLVGGGSTTVTERITDDSDFRRAMLQSSPVFAFESTEVAISHWASLWDCSAGLDRRTHDARQSLLIHAIEPLLDNACSKSLTPIRTLRDALESTMDDRTRRGITATRETCDWIVLNNLLGENERTLQWMSARVGGEWHAAQTRASDGDPSSGIQSRWILVDASPVRIREHRSIDD